MASAEVVSGSTGQGYETPLTTILQQVIDEGLKSCPVILFPFGLLSFVVTSNEGWIISILRVYIYV